jgi:hypothetical protein
MQERLVVYYKDYYSIPYAVYDTQGFVYTRCQTLTSFRLVFRVKRKDKTNAQVCS